ncbi:MAG: hypothetical protein IPH20_24305 [Bacteroidales bacterium]|nr:hypothetical protein [Bacteroidales bacterium]
MNEARTRAPAIREIRADSLKIYQIWVSNQLFSGLASQRPTPPMLRWLSVI